jgi:murein DD-endopeptidase MepM/ murein hydrolase activator NlpD
LYSLAKLLFLGLLTYFSAPALAAEENQQSNLQKVNEAIDGLRKSIFLKGKNFHRLQEGAQAPLYLWQEENTSPQKRKILKTYAGLEIKTLLRHLEALEEKKSEIEGDLHLLELQRAELKAAPEVTHLKQTRLVDAVKPFYCTTSMAEQLGDAKIKIQQPFGEHKDTETGLVWKSSGWWLANIKNEIKACSAGTVIFAGKIEGRGRVVLLDHGGGLMTLYANLAAEAQSPLSKGLKVSAGFVLGLAPERLYFEVRRNGEALDPKGVVSARVLDNFVF